MVFYPVIEPALKGDKSGSSATDDKTGSSTEEGEPAVTETDTEGGATEGEESENPPGEPEEAKVGNVGFLTSVSARLFSTAVCSS